MLNRTAPLLAAICLLPFANSLSPTSALIPTEGAEMFGDDGSFDIHLANAGAVAVGSPHLLSVTVSPRREVSPAVIVSVTHHEGADLLTPATPAIFVDGIATAEFTLVPRSTGERMLRVTVDGRMLSGDWAHGVEVGYFQIRDDGSGLFFDELPPVVAPTTLIWLGPTAADYDPDAYVSPEGMPSSAEGLFKHYPR